jgi:hypothetical protein
MVPDRKKLLISQGLLGGIIGFAFQIVLEIVVIAEYYLVVVINVPTKGSFLSAVFDIKVLLSLLIFPIILATFIVLSLCLTVIFKNNSIFISVVLFLIIPALRGTNDKVASVISFLPADSGFNSFSAFLNSLIFKMPLNSGDIIKSSVYLLTVVVFSLLAIYTFEKRD